MARKAAKPKYPFLTTVVEYPFKESNIYGEKVTEFIARLQEVYDAIPPEYQDSARFSAEHVHEQDYYDGYHFANVTVTYLREMNDKELSKAQAEYDATIARQRAYDEKQFAALQKKLGK